MKPMCIRICSFILTLMTLSWLSTTPVFAQLPTSTPTPRSSTTVYLPAISGGGTPAPAPPGQSGRVYGLVGQLRDASGQAFGNYLIVNGTTLYGIVGSTAALEEQIGILRNRQPPIMVKVWGNIETVASSIPIIVATDLLPGDLAPTPTAAVLPPAVQPTIRVKFTLVNLYTGPSAAYALAGQVSANQICDLMGRDSSGAWWEVTCANNLTGWIASSLVEINGSTTNLPIIGAPATATPTPIPTPTSAPPTATPTASITDAWRATYFNNTQLSGAPVAIADVALVNFNWGTGSPDPAVNADAFSARFERTIHFDPGFYRFIATADDGIRVWLDNQLMFDEWHGSTNTIYTTGRALSGDHVIRIEYYEGGGNASLRFTYNLMTSAFVWTANYYGNQSLSGTPVLSQQEPRSAFALDYAWGASSPLPSVVPIGNWSARWVGQFAFDAGNYVFRANANGGVRVYINDILVIDDWREGYHEDSNLFLGIGADTHTIRIEYYDGDRNANVRVWWYRDTSVRPVPQ